MTENYSFKKVIPKIDVDIEVTVGDRDLLRKLDDAIRDVIVKHYNLTK